MNAAKLDEDALPSTIRPELPNDAAGIRRVHEAAFPTAGESRLVDLLRERALAVVSLVAESADEIVGHVLFSPVRLEGPRTNAAGDAAGLGLAPLAVLPSWQRRGLGGRLVRAGLAACRELNAPFVVVLGEPEYYGRFGFVRASSIGLGNEYGADAEFMVLELRPGGLPTDGGLVRYCDEFNQVGF